jgi:hypothetical protein
VADVERLREHYEFRRRGEIEVKGKGRMTTYFLTGRRGAVVPSSGGSGGVAG